MTGGVPDELVSFFEAAYAEAGWPVKECRHVHDGIELVIEPFPPFAVIWQVSRLATEAGLDQLRLCWPCYQANPNSDGCEHDWQNSPQPTREELLAA